jgi:hypothetical protein
MSPGSALPGTGSAGLTGRSHSKAGGDDRLGRQENPLSRNQCWKHLVVLSPALEVPGSIGKIPAISGHSLVQSRRDFVLSALDFSQVRAESELSIVYNLLM